MIHPAQIEERLLSLERDINEAQDDLGAAEDNFHRTKATYEIAMAKARIDLGRSAKMGVQDRQDQALVLNQSKFQDLAIAEAWVRGSRANVSRLRTQVDITRSLGASVRSSMEM